MIIKTQEEFEALPVGSVSLRAGYPQGIVLQRTPTGWVNISFTSYTRLGAFYSTQGFAEQSDHVRLVFEFPREVFLPENVVNRAAEADILPVGTISWVDDARGASGRVESVKTESGWAIINPAWSTVGMTFTSEYFAYPRRYSLPVEEDYILVPDETTTKEVTMSAITSENFMVKRYSMFEFSLSRAEWASWQSSVDWSEFGDLTSMNIIAQTQEEAIDKARAVASPRQGYTWVFKVLDVRELR